MSLIVQKFGGTSVASSEHILRVALIIKRSVDAGHQVVVVVSAMAGETDRLIELACQIQNMPSRRELDVLLATGEQVTIALLAMALHALGCPARSYTGSQARISTDRAHSKARILDINVEPVRADLARGYVAVVAGFQGSDPDGNITTLGRGGSDVTAVALAAALDAQECQIYTDVKGVYTTDPRVEPRARRLSAVSFEEMLELASLGAKVVQIRAVEFAGRYRVPIRVLSTFEPDEGTLITLEEERMEQPLVAGIAFNREEARFSLLGIPDEPGVASLILGPVSQAHIEVDMIVQNVAKSGRTDFTFTVHRDDYQSTLHVLRPVAHKLQALELIGDCNIAKLSLVGVGMRSHAGVADTMFRALGAEGINILMVTTSEIKVSVVIDEKYLELGVRTLHAAFELDQEPVEEIGLG